MEKRPFGFLGWSKGACEGCARVTQCHFGGKKNLVSVFIIIRVYLTNRFHVAVRLFSNRSQMTSKCGKNKKVAHEATAECVTDVLTTF